VPFPEIAIELLSPFPGGITGRITEFPGVDNWKTEAIPTPNVRPQGDTRDKAPEAPAVFALAIRLVA
jgi:hypothetical protein